MTRAVDLVGELEASVTELERRGGIGWLRQFGISLQTVVAIGAIGAAVARPADDGLYATSEEGAAGHDVLVVPVCTEREAVLSPWGDYHPPLIDLIALDPRSPERWRLRLGLADALGAWGISEATNPNLIDRDPPPLRLNRNPLSWLRDGGTGTVILHPSTAQFLLCGVRQVIAEDEPHAAELHRHLNRRPPGTPTIMFPQHARAAA